MSDDDSFTEESSHVGNLRRKHGCSQPINTDNRPQHPLSNSSMFSGWRRPPEPLQPGRTGCPYRPRSISHRNVSAGAGASPDRFFDSHSGSPYISHLLSVSSVDDGFHRKNIHLSQKLPAWIWFLLARSLGIKLARNEKPIFALFVHVITLTAAFTFGISGAWFKIYDIKSEFSKTTVLIGSVSIIIGLGWMLFGIYAHRLAGMLFSNKNFVESVRMHSKTFLKISITLIVIILGFLVVIVNLYSDFDLFDDNSCTNIQLSPVVCKIMYSSRVVYSFFCVTWNLLVAFILLSVCRTHTIGIRRFMRDLAVDAQIYETFWTQHVLGIKPVTQGQEVTSSTEVYHSEWYIWEDQLNDDTENIEVTSEGVFLESISGNVALPTASSTPSPPRSDKSIQSCDTDLPGDDEQKQQGQKETSCRHMATLFDKQQGIFYKHFFIDRTVHTTAFDEPVVDHWLERKIAQTAAGSTEKDQSTELDPALNYLKESGEMDGEEISGIHDNKEDDSWDGPLVLTNDDLLFSYWKIYSRLSMTSQYLQRWMFSWIAFMLIWCADYIIYWTSHDATLTGILEFIIPLILLLIISSAYAEVNAEGQRMIKCICPTEDRLTILFFLNQQPLQMQVFGFTISYNAIMTVILAFSVAFASRIVLDEVLK